MGSEAFLPAIQQATKAGIPTVSIVNDVLSADTVNIAPNTWQDNAVPVTTIINAIGQKGNVLLVQGIPGTQADDDTINQYAELLAPCPNITNDGSIDGASTTRRWSRVRVLQFLATHPQPVGGRVPGRGYGAADHSGLPAGGQAGALGRGRGRAEGVARLLEPEQLHLPHGRMQSAEQSGLANETVRVTRRMLAGQGVKVNNIVWYRADRDGGEPQHSTSQPSWTPETPGSAENPPST